eukprot:520581-Pyramimonas_sp.AAC.1
MLRAPQWMLRASRTVFVFGALFSASVKRGKSERDLPRVVADVVGEIAGDVGVHNQRPGLWTRTSPASSPTASATTLGRSRSDQFQQGRVKFFGGERSY